MVKLLVIDDNGEFRALMHEVLTDRGYEVFTAANGVQGLESVRKESPDIVITDIVMPEKEGVEVILELQKSGNAVPIIAMSGEDLGGSYLQMAKKLGAAVVISKPFKFDDLITEINQLLS